MLHSSSSRMRVIYHNWSAMKQRPQCRDRATLQGVRILSAILKIIFRHILFFFVFNAV